MPSPGESRPGRSSWPPRSTESPWPEQPSPERSARLLDLASDPRLPLAERIGLLSRCATGLDDWYQYQVGGAVDPPSTLRPALSALGRPWSSAPLRVDQLAAVHDPVAGIVSRQSALVADDLLPALADAGVAVVDLHTVDEPDRAFLRRHFERSIFPTLTPLAVDHGHPFPYISNLCLNLVVRVHHSRAGGTRVARVKVPPLLRRFVPLPDGVRVVPVEQVVAAHVGALFPSMAILETHVFRVTRTALLPPPPDGAGSAPDPFGHQLHRRRFGPVVRLEAAADTAPDLLSTVATGVGVPGPGVFRVGGLIDPGALTRLWPDAPTARSAVPAPTWTPWPGLSPSTVLAAVWKRLPRWFR